MGIGKKSKKKQLQEEKEIVEKAKKQARKDIKQTDFIKVLGESEINQALIRGQIINHSVQLELKVEQIILYYFLEKNGLKTKEFYSTILTVENFNFSFKLNVFTFIVENHYEFLIEKYIDFKKDIEKIKNIRNDCAHRHLIPRDASPLEFDFVSLKNNNGKLRKEPLIVEFNVFEFVEIFLKVQKVTDNLLELIKPR